MKIKVWGCRGSLPTPGSKTLRYGGNTTCLEIIGRDGCVIVVDAGSGLRQLGQAIRRDNSIREIFMLLTHAHLDHLMGFPFFTPAYFSEYTITICGGPKPQTSIKKYLSRGMQAPFFPVEFDVLKAKIQFGCTCPHSGNIGGISVTPIPLSHPNGGYGFKFTEGGKSFVFLTDNELREVHDHGLKREKYVEFCRGADLLFHDAQFTEQEYAITKGWGHSTFADATSLALEAGVKRFGLFHHDPDRTDAELDRQTRVCQRQIVRAGGTVKCFAVAEGKTYVV